jgi:RNA recognition motif-containing protein
MTKKSKAQIDRMKRRAEARGEDYVYVPPLAYVASEGEKEDKTDSRRFVIACKLRKELDQVENNEEMKSKERRAAKRKAEAIAAEEAGCSAEELVHLYEEHVREQDAAAKSKPSDDDTKSKPRRNPYIVFVGQLSYSTTRDSLFSHIKNELGGDHKVTEETIQIRLLTDTKTKKSRGMAFVETMDPELLYALLKLHHTPLEGRRINVERSAGGKASSETRRSKLQQLRKEQENHMAETVDKMLSHYISSGEMQENELDDGVIALCKRHSAAVVEAALVEYTETEGRDKDNPSAYLTFIIGKFATEGIHDRTADKKESKHRHGGSERKGGDERPRKRRAPSSDTQTELGVVGHKLQSSSTFLRAGVDMRTSDGSKHRDLLKLFPSMSRGRGRGRGYM